MRLRNRFIVISTALVVSCPLQGSAPPKAKQALLLSTPNCPQTVYEHQAELLQALFASDYPCTEDIARAIQPHASSATITALLSLIASNENDLARRNAVRALGRLAEGASSPSARELVTRIRADAVRATLQASLQNDRDNYLLQDVIWIFDTFFFPAIAVQPDLERISADPELDPALRARAIRAAGRLIASKNGRLPAEDLTFTLSSLRSDNAGVRAEAALIAARFRDSQLDGPMRRSLIAALEEAWQRESPLRLPIDDPAPQIQPGRYDSASVATQLTALVAVARALDRYEETTRRFERLRSEYEALSLTSTLQTSTITIRAGLPADELRALLQLMERQRAVFFDLLGPSFTTPVPDDSRETLTAVIFPTRAVYREYMRAFVGFRPDVDGVYVEAQATLYTFQRTAAQSANTLEESLQHEYAHYLAGRYLFPGVWHDPNYHAEPKGWADEGLAEFFAGLVFEHDGGYIAPPRQRQLEVICARPNYRRLEALLAQREGYDGFGSFDYDHAWAFTHYLLTERQDVALRLYTAYRAKTYRLADVARIAGVESVAALEADWHTALDRWCHSAAAE